MYWLVHTLTHGATETEVRTNSGAALVVNILLLQQLPPHPPSIRHLLSSSSLRGCILEGRGEWGRIASAVRWPGFSSAIYEEDLGQMTSSLCAIFSLGLKWRWSRSHPCFRVTGRSISTASLPAAKCWPQSKQNREKKKWHQGSEGILLLLLCLTLLTSFPNSDTW